MIVTHESKQIECTDLGQVSTALVKAHDFLVDDRMGYCHLVMREQSECNRLITFWDCDGFGHVFNVKQDLPVVRPTDLDDDTRVWATADKVAEYVERVTKARAERLAKDTETVA